MNKQTTSIIALILLLVLGLIGCTPTEENLEPAAAPLVITPVVTKTASALAPVPTKTAERVEEETAITESETEAAKSDSQEETPIKENAMPLPENPTAQERIQQATNDLTERMAISADQVEFVNYETVTWRDGSLGCPQPGLAYTQALQDGYRIQLMVDGQQYDYHGGRGQPFLCESAQKTSPAPSSDS